VRAGRQWTRGGQFGRSGGLSLWDSATGPRTSDVVVDHAPATVLYHVAKTLVWFLVAVVLVLVIRTDGRSPVFVQSTALGLYLNAIE